MSEPGQMKRYTMIDAGRLERLRAKRLAEDERLVCMERALSLIHISEPTRPY